MTNLDDTRTYLDDHAKERSTFVIPVTFRDEAETLTLPKVATWTLTDTLGNVINSRLQQPITPATTVDIVLFGGDLALALNQSNERVLLVEWTFDSDLGNDLPVKDEVYFIIDNLVAVS